MDVIKLLGIVDVHSIFTLALISWRIISSRGFFKNSNPGLPSCSGITHITFSTMFNFIFLFRPIISYVNGRLTTIFNTLSLCLSLAKVTSLMMNFNVLQSHEI